MNIPQIEALVEANPDATCAGPYTVDILGFTLTMSKHSFADPSKPPQFHAGLYRNGVSIDVFAYFHGKTWDLDITARSIDGADSCQVRGVALTEIEDAWLKRASLHAPVLANLVLDGMGR